jgi:hypothetical protein
MAEQLGEVSRNGGWRGHPNSLAALERHRWSFSLVAKCRREGCRQVAVRGQTLCTRHLGRNSPLSNGGGRGESRMLGRLERLGLLPLDLIALPVWRGLSGLPTGTRAPARLQLVQAWDKRQDQPLHWAKAQRAAMDLGQRPGQRQATAPWYENA